MTSSSHRARLRPSPQPDSTLGAITVTQLKTLGAVTIVSSVREKPRLVASQFKTVAVRSDHEEPHSNADTTIFLQISLRLDSFLHFVSAGLNP